MARLRTYAPINRRSKKVTKAEPQFRAILQKVSDRSEGQCEVNFYPTEPRLRCHHSATDHHHIMKPRRSYHNENAIVHLCRHHHDRCDWPYHRGRLIIKIMGGGSFLFSINYTSDKYISVKTEAT